MSDLFKSAFGYFNSSNVTDSNNDFVGQIVEIGNIKLIVKKVIAEGGFAFVYIVEDPNSGKEYALKRLVSTDAENDANILEEINYLKKLSGHPNIIQYLAAASVDKSVSSHGKNEYLILTELCTKGNLVDYLKNRTNPLPPNVICQIFWQTCRAVQHMHFQIPPVTHRDLKIENLLIGSDGMIKLCDFGSCTLKVHQPDSSWSAGQHSLLEDQMAQFTTPMYRAPEMVDTWNNYPIGTPCDIWALGCILYTLCFMSHPFHDSAKLKILNANYTIPSGNPAYLPFHEIIKGCLKVNPETRLTITDVLERLAAIAESNNYDLKAPVNLSSDMPTAIIDSASSQESQNEFGKSSRPQRPAPPLLTSNSDGSQRADVPRNTNSSNSSWMKSEGTSQPKNASGKHEHGLFSTIKGGAGSFLKNLKDTSNKVMQSVQQSIARSDLDVSYISSRIIVMPFPAEGIESAYKSNHIEDVRAFLEARHSGGRYCVFNLAGKSYPPSRLGTGRVVDCPFGGFRKVPPLRILYNLCEDVVNFLEKNQKNVVVIHCTDGRTSSAVMVACLLMYCRVTETLENALQMFAVKRLPPDLQPSELRYLGYFSRIVKNPPILPHTRPVSLVSLIMSPVPLFTKSRDGCRPYVELFQGDEKVKSTLIDYDRMRLYHASEGKVMIPINATVCGDVTLSVFHARQNLGGVMSSGKPTGHKICQFQFHTGYVSPEETNLQFSRSELDDPADGDHYPERFTTTLNILVCDYFKELRPMPWETSKRKIDPAVLFANSIELDENIENFVKKHSIREDNERKLANGPPSKPPPPRFLDTRENVRTCEPVPTNENLVSLGSTESKKIIKQESVDLLGLGLESKEEKIVDPSSTSTNRTPDRFQELNDIFNSENSNPKFLESRHPHNSNNVLFDPFESENPMTSSNTQNSFPLGNWTNAESVHAGVHPPASSGLIRNSSTPNLDQRAKDPFAEFGNLVSGLNIGGSNSKPVTPISGSPNVQSPIHKPPSQTSFFGVSQTAQHSKKSPGGTPIHQNQQNRQNSGKGLTDVRTGPDYSRSHFDSAFGKKGQASGEKTGKTNTDVFGDLLGSQGYDFASKKDAGPRTMNELRKEDLAKELDPDKMKIFEWTDGKKGNIRALLCSINTVLWEECKWKGVDMSQLVSASDVKKAYRKACLAVHPDKQMGTEHENIAKLIFVELNNAWSDFESDSNQQGLFAGQP